MNFLNFIYKNKYLFRECIIESKMTFDVSSDDWQAYLKNKVYINLSVTLQGGGGGAYLRTKV